jgi:hypothetical protein
MSAKCRVTVFPTGDPAAIVGQALSLLLDGLNEGGRRSTARQSTRR